VLFNRVDQLLGGEDDSGFSTRRSITESSDIESLTASLIDGLYKQIKTNDVKKKQLESKNTNYVSSKKQVVTYDKAS